LMTFCWLDPGATRQGAHLAWMPGYEHMLCATIRLLLFGSAGSVRPV
jgi:hypothetical protein